MRWALATAAMLLASATVQAQLAPSHAMRCGTHLLSETATLPETIDTCGAPSDRVTRTEHRSRAEVGKNGQVTIYEQDVVVDVLHYDFGPHQFLYELIFEDSRMVAMLKRGYGTAR